MSACGCGPLPWARATSISNACPTTCACGFASMARSATYRQQSRAAIARALICARLKVLAGMDIAEHRVPQDGRLSVTHRRAAPRFPRVDVPHHSRARKTRHAQVFDQRCTQARAGDAGTRGLLVEDSTHERSSNGRRGQCGTVTARPAAERRRRYKRRTSGADRKRAATSRRLKTPVGKVARINQGRSTKRGFRHSRKGLRAVLRQDPDIIMVGESRDGGDVDDGHRGVAHGPSSCFPRCTPLAPLPRSPG